MPDLNPYRPPTAPIDTPSTRDPVAKCPKCGAESATKVGYNWWGGALGPRLFHVVKCLECGTQYNGQTGGKLTMVIIVYQAVIVFIVLAVWLLVRG